MRWIVIWVALLVCACGPSHRLPPGYVVAGAPGTYPLFDSCGAAQPFELGEEVRWQVGERLDQVRVVRRERCSMAPFAPSTRYVLSINGTTYGTDHEFFAIPQTPEEDFIIQSVTPNEDFPAVSYAFLWRLGDRVVEISVRSYDDLSQRQRRFCVPQTFERPHPQYVFRCEFESRRNVIRYYREVVYPPLRAEIGGGQ